MSIACKNVGLLRAANVRGGGRLLQAYTRLVTGAQMGRIDRGAIERGIPGTKLMLAAGKGVFKVLESISNDLEHRRIVILCGKGNNGGDGFIVGTLAHRAKAEVTLFLFADPDQVQGDAAHFLQEATEQGLAITRIESEQELDQVSSAISKANLVIDALLGTGLKGSPRSVIAAAIDLVDKSDCPVISVDVPSGMNPDNGSVAGSCINADHTVTFAYPKRGHFFQPGRARCGRLHLVDIGITDQDAEAENVPTSLIAPSGAKALLPRRAPDAHKGDCGRVVILAGSVGLTGAAALAAKAAAKTGAGLITVGTPESLNDILEVKLTEAMTRPLPEVRHARCLALRARGQIQDLIESADCVAIGPGLGRHRETAELVRRLLGDIKVPVILDADALNALNGDSSLLKQLAVPAIITPHPGEFSHLTGIEIGRVKSHPICECKKLAKAAGVTVVLKGSPTVIATPEGSAFVNSSGNAGMATGGTGDVLTGVLTALVGQGLDSVHAATLGTYLHGLAGDLAAEVTGMAGLTAGDLVDHLPAAEQTIRKLEDRNRYIITAFN